ncbi:hypothetical protein FHETE_4860 [Fusarium heterosporum]|uniref:Uncharacterized protein n=1 Tax=Fusarium heterosporum TaxID=42747 RepID=A0A8H5WSQ9_FUSHE|nr:hypothetical protein FHETE_4860 [Fusarium heterosporum]
MTGAARPMGLGRLEIVFIAIVVLVLVLLLGIFLLVRDGLRNSSEPRDTEFGQRETHWNILHQTGQGTRTCRNDEASFIKSVRRRSRSMADELRLELNNLRRNLTLLTIPSRSLVEGTNTGGAQRLSIDQLSSFSSPNSESSTDCESCFEYLDSPLSATGREEDAAGTQRKRARMAGYASEYGDAQQ